MSFTQTYYEAITPRPETYPPLAHDIDTDVCVIGGGFAGLWTARALQKRHKAVVLIERKTIAHGASGRSGGFVSAGYNTDLDFIRARVGMDDTRSLYRLSRMGVELVREASNELLGINPAPGYLQVSYEDDAEAKRREIDEYARDFDHKKEFWPTERVRAELQSDLHYQGVHDPEALQIQPLELALALAEDFRKRGGKIYENTAALDADVDGVRKIVTTERGKIRAEHIVFAANEIPIGNFPELSRTVIPMATYAAFTRPAREIPEAIRYRGCVEDDLRAFNYYRLFEDRLLWGAGISTSVKRPANLERWLKKRIVAIYPQLSGIEIEQAWCGVLGFAVHRMPQIGLLQPGAWIASAFGGQGNNTTAMAGELIASAITERDDRWRLFAPFGLVWAGGAFGKAFAQMNWWSRSLLDRVDDLKRKRKTA